MGQPKFVLFGSDAAEDVGRFEHDTSETRNTRDSAS